MRCERVEEADVLAQRIGKEIVRHGKTRLSRLNAKTGIKDIWAAVRQLTGRRQEVGKVDGVSAETLKEHYARISTDPSYCALPRKHSACSRRNDGVSEWRMVNILDNLAATATGLDKLPACFLRRGAPVLLSQIRLSVSNVGAPCSGGLTFRQYYFTDVYTGHLLTSVEHFTAIVPGELLRRGTLNARGVAKQSDGGPIGGYLINDARYGLGYNND